jgi:16S rRNA processing protein RimM
LQGNPINRTMRQYRNIGKILAAHGWKGELLISHELGKKTALQGLEVIFLEAGRDEMLPYFIAYSRMRNAEQVWIKLEGLDSREEAGRLAGRVIWITEEEFKIRAGKKAPISWVGYHLLDGDKDLGEILEIIEQPHQVLCRIEIEGKEALVPLHGETLRKIDNRKKQVHVVLPEGLLDIYRQA